MGMFKQMKDMKATVAAAPDMIANAQAMGAQAQEMAALQQQQALAAQQAAFGQAAPAAAADPAATAPIAGVSLQQYADISRGLQAYNYDQSKAVEIAAAQGVSAEAWEEAMNGWNARIQGNPAVASEFNRLYTGR